MNAPRGRDVIRRRRRRLFYRRRRWLSTFVVLLVLVACSAYTVVAVGGGLEGALTAQQTPPSSENAPDEPARPTQAVRAPALDAAPEAPQLMRADSPEAAVYGLMASEVPGIRPESLLSVQRSTVDKSWASVWVADPDRSVDREGDFVVFLRKKGDEWEARRSIRADEPDYPENELAALDGVPKDLVAAVYPQLRKPDAPEPREASAETGELPEFSFAPPPTEPVFEGVPEAEQEQVGEGFEAARRVVERYEEEHGGVAGFWVADLEGDWGYGVRPDESFFSASVIKIPIMVAVYRKAEEGEISLSDMVEVREEDWAAGAGWLQWQEPGVEQTVYDMVWLMMAQSDNVATNALVRLVGGPEYVNEVARSLGAEDTVLYQKVTSERGVVPEIDNRTTARDMAVMMQKVAEGEAAKDVDCEAMVEIMSQGDVPPWLATGVPDDVEVPNKTGWLYKVYDDVAIFRHNDRSYVLAVMTKHGAWDVEEGEAVLKDISAAVWKAQGDPRQRNEKEGEAEGRKPDA